MKVLACLAASIDGKISDAQPEAWVRLGSDADLQRLFNLRAQSQALVFGASTLRAFAKIRWPGKLPAQTPTASTPAPPVHVLLTRSWNLPTEAPLFQQWQAHWAPIQVFSPTPAPAWVADWPIQAHRLQADTPMPQQVLALLQAQGFGSVLVEGGGEVLNQFVQAGALDELHLTLTPWLLGGRDTASLMGTAQPGLCLKDFMGQQPLTLLSSQAVGNEVFLTYQLQRQAFS